MTNLPSNLPGTSQMIQVNIHEAKTHLSKLIQKVVEGEEVIIAKDNKPLARLVYIDKKSGRRKLGSANGSIHIAPDFDAPLEDFRDHM